MVFADLFFLFVFLAAFIVMYLVGGAIDRWVLVAEDKLHPRNETKNFVLILFSLIFYAWGEPVYVFLMILSVLMNYIVGRAIDNSEEKRKLMLGIGVACNILVLGVFKYAGFFAEQVNSLGIPCPIPNIALPIGISFYTFQSLSYLVDVYRKDSPAQKSYWGLLLYISMFPQLIAGPIVRYGTIVNEIHNRRVNSADIADGITRFMLGLGKKVFIANQLSEIADQFLVSGLKDLSTTGAWVGIIAFTLQIYYDFSGYSDMAIGIGRCMGFRFNENFNHPYCCGSITDFWRRWHMSLGSFFRDYVYIPMGGNRRHQWFNILVVWFLTGMWHGASWNFVLWGLYFGVILVIEKYTLLRWKVPAVIMHVYALFAVVLGWGIFYFVDMAQMGKFFSALFGNCKEVHNMFTMTAITDNFWLWVIALLFIMPVRKWATQLCAKATGGEDTTSYNLIITGTRIVFSAVVLVLCTALLVGATNNAFLYTRF
ncbi:MAG: MBOAT family protein [Muribaculaceae bacterium]|nr:MBOAT family protein [Muribaculaceae bacterium]